MYVRKLSVDFWDDVRPHSLPAVMEMHPLAKMRLRIRRATASCVWEEVARRHLKEGP